MENGRKGGKQLGTTLTPLGHPPFRTTPDRGEEYEIKSANGQAQDCPTNSCRLTAASRLERCPEFYRLFRPCEMNHCLFCLIPPACQETTLTGMAPPDKPYHEGFRPDNDLVMPCC